VADAHQRLANRIGSHGALIVTLAGGALLALGATDATTRIYDSAVDSNGIESVDRPILRRAMTLRSPELDAAAAGIARVFAPIGLPAMALAVAGGLSLRQKSRTPLLLTAIDAKLARTQFRELPKAIAVNAGQIPAASRPPRSLKATSSPPTSSHWTTSATTTDCAPTT
jgi:hypothetical protein